MKPGPEAIPHLEMWKDLPFLVKARARPARRVPPPTPPPPPAPQPSGRRCHLSQPHAPLPQPRALQDGIVFSIDTIKSKARPNYQTVL